MSGAIDEMTAGGGVSGATRARRADSPRVAWLALLMALGVLGLMVLVGTLHLRTHLREHLVDRDGEVLYAVALARQYANGAGSNLTLRISHPADQLTLALEISQMREETLAVRLFDALGNFVTAVPAHVTPGTLAPDDLRALQRIQPASHFRNRVGLDQVFWLIDTNAGSVEALPLLEVNIPLHARGDRRLAGVAQLIVDGRRLAREYAAIDRHLWWLALALYAAGALLLSGVLIWAYRQLQLAGRRLADRTAHLLRANHELALAAKTSALGSVTAHLIHGLSNPLANLQNLVASSGPAAGGGLDAVADATRRMRDLVDEAVRVLAEERVGEHYQIKLSELAEVLGARFRSNFAIAPIELETAADRCLSNRTANLAILILENLVANAVRVTPSGGQVRVRIVEHNGAGAICSVSDSGRGLPPEILSHLFTPCRSTHGGNGLGLAISKQLAIQMGAGLELRRTSPEGTTFDLVLPPRLFEAQDEASPRTPSRDRPGTRPEDLTSNPDPL